MASLPYPRIHITNVRGHGIPPCPLCVFPPGGACSPHGMHGTHRSLGCVYCPQNTLRRVWHPCHTHAAHCQSSHRIHGIHRSFWRKIFSHRFHGWAQIRRVWHPCHTHATLCQSSHGIHRIHRNFWRRRASHRFHRCSQMVRFLWVLWEDSLVAAWVWQGCDTLLICAHPCNLRGEYTQPENSVKSVNSVG